VDETPTVKEGDWPYTRTALIEFPTAEAFDAWFNSPEYQALAEHRHAASTGSIAVIKSFTYYGLIADIAPCPKSADTVAKVENRAVAKISRRSIVSRLRRCNALQDRYDGLWSVLCETMWSLHVAA
jgi:hypothetical protein